MIQHDIWLVTSQQPEHSYHTATCWVHHQFIQALFDIKDWLIDAGTTIISIIIFPCTLWYFNIAMETCLIGKSTTNGDFPQLCYSLPEGKSHQIPWKTTIFLWFPCDFYGHFQPPSFPSQQRIRHRHLRSFCPSLRLSQLCLARFGWRFLGETWLVDNLGIIYG